MSSYYFTEEHELFRQSLRAFLDKEVKPNIDKYEEQGFVDREVWKKMGDQGFLGLTISEEYGGAGLDFFYDVIFLEEINKCYSAGFAASTGTNQYLFAPYLFKHGSEHIKKTFLPGVCAGTTVGSLAITEPGAGSDVQNVKTTAVREGDYYIVNGAKTFITNAVYGDYITTTVKTDPTAKAGGVSLLIIDRNAEGVTASKLDKLGWRASDTAELGFNNVKVPVENLVGEEGKGFYYLMGGLQLERLTLGIAAYAASELAIEYSLDYMKERKAFGKSIDQFQVLRHRIADLASETECVKQFLYYVSRMHNDGKYAVKECSMAKLMATELSDKLMSQCLQFFGGYGYMEEYKIARMYRDTRLGTIGGGTSEIMREVLAKMIIDDVKY